MRITSYGESKTFGRHGFADNTKSMICTDDLKSVVGGNVIEISIDSVLTHRARGQQTVGTDMAAFAEGLLSGGVGAVQ